MTTETERIKKLLRNNWEGPMWHGGNLQEVLKDISWEKAFRKPAGFSHNIYELVKHMLCWRNFTLQYLNGSQDYTVELNSETDWTKEYSSDEVTWLKALEELETNQQQLMAAMEKVTDAMLDEMVPGKKFRWYVLLHGALHHDIYHSAQISILKK